MTENLKHIFKEIYSQNENFTVTPCRGKATNDIRFHSVSRLQLLINAQTILYAVLPRDVSVLPFLISENLNRFKSQITFKDHNNAKSSYKMSN